MNVSQCAIFRDLSHSVEYHLLTATKGILCSAGGLRIALLWRQYGVRFLVHENTKVMFRFFLGLNIVISALFGFIHLFELIRLRFDCYLLNFRYVLLTRGLGLTIIYASQHVTLLLSFERLLSAMFPAQFERNSSLLFSISLAIITIVGTIAYGMVQLSKDFKLFFDSNIYLALANVNIPANQLGFENLVSRMAMSNSIALVTLCIDFYINYMRKYKISPCLAVSYQINENRRIVLTLIPIELTQALLGFFTGLTFIIHRQLITSPTLIEHQIFHESVTLSVCFPLILTFFIKHSAEKSLNRPRPIDPEVDHFEMLRQSWNHFTVV